MSLLRQIWVSSFFLVVILFAACDQSTIDNARQDSEKISIPGWLTVLPGIDKHETAGQKGLFAQTYDEFVGGLIDDGIDIALTTWFKSTYGNKNLLWVPDAKVGLQRLSALIKSKGDFNPAVYTFEKGTLAISRRQWVFAGYSDNSAGAGSKAFNSFVFVCGDESEGASVFYWGDGIATSPNENDSVKTLLSQLSSHCKE